MGIALEHATQAGSLRLEGVVDISNAAELKTALLKAIASGTTVCVSVQAVSELDVTAYQLLWAAEREAHRQGLKFILTEQLPLPIKGALSELGFESSAFLE